MKIKLLFLLFLTTFTTYSQYTLIPDSNFEQKLIDLEIDTDGLNGKVLTSNISNLTSLDVSQSSIKSLTGIEDFVALTRLHCSLNKLTVIDVSKNLALVTFDCSINQLTNLDVSKNIALENFGCGENQLTTLDVSKNVALNYLNCALNQLTYLDVSKNVALTTLFCIHNRLTDLDLSKNEALVFFNCYDNQISYLDVSKNAALIIALCSYNRLFSLDFSKNNALKHFDCSSNNLYHLNLKNGENTLLDSDIKISNNPNLTCIQVDDVTYSNSNWAGAKDATATYSTDCSSLGIEDFIFDKVAIYPNPTKEELHIDNIVLEKAIIYDALGTLVKTATFTSGANTNTIHLEGSPTGIYYIYLESEGANTAKKIIVE